MKGGSSNSGRAPDPDAYRRERDKGDWVTLPDSYNGPVPDFPFEGATDREMVWWDRLWSQGQAVMWVIDKQDIEVAVYVRLLTQLESFGKEATASALGELRRISEALGLSQVGLRANKWRMGGKSEMIGQQSGAPSAVARKTKGDNWLSAVSVAGG